jgi:hypothetical protein
MTEPTPPVVEPPANPEPPDPTPEPAKDLGDAGKKAIAEERAARKAAEKERTELAVRLKEFEDRDKSELEKANERATAAEQRIQAATARAVRAEVRALADGFADREDAVLNLGDLTKYAGKDGEVDADAITAELSKVLERKPHLARTNGTPRTPAPDPSQGARGATPPDLDAQIAAAQKAGNYREVIRLNGLKMAATSKK